MPDPTPSVPSSLASALPAHFDRTAFGKTVWARLVEAPRRPVLLLGASGTGKSALLHQELAELANQHGAWYLAIAMAPREQASESALAALRQLHLVEMGHAPSAQASIQDLVNALMKRRPGKTMPLVLALDDVHEHRRPKSNASNHRSQTEANPASAPTKAEALGELLAAFAAHPREVWLILTAQPGGAAHDLLQGNSADPLHLTLSIDLPLLGAEFVSHVQAQHAPWLDGSSCHADLMWAFEQLLHRPGSLVEFAKDWSDQRRAQFLISEDETTKPQQRATDEPAPPVSRILARFQAKSSPDRAYTQRFLACTPLQRSLLIEIVRDPTALFAPPTRQRLTPDGAPLLTVSAIEHALKELEHRRLIRRGGAYGAAIEDAGLARWLQGLARSPST